jgi:hypothetical protein
MSGYVNHPRGFGAPADVFAGTLADIRALPEYDTEAARTYAFARTLMTIRQLPEVNA